MFTVKLFKGHTIKIIGANEINIYASGNPSAAPAERTNEVREISVCNLDGAHQEAYYIADRNKPRPQGFAEDVVFYDCAYIENTNGATTETVRAY